MSYFRYNGNEPTEIKYGNDDVKALKYGSDYVWAKAFTLTITTNTGVSSISVKRTASLVGDIATNVLLSNGATIYYGDTLEITVTPSTYYSLNQTSPYTFTVSGNTTISPTATRNTNTITVTLNSNVSNISVTYYNTSGTQVTHSYTRNTVITAQQGRAYSWSATASTGYTLSQSSGSGTLTNNIPINPTATLSPYTITFAKGGSKYGSWGSEYKTAYYGDRLTRSGNSIICEYYYENLQQWVERWTNTFTNGSATGYTYSVSYSSITSPVSSGQTITATTSRTANTYTISYVMGSNDAQHNGTYAISYTYSASSQTKSIGTATRSGYTYTVSTNKGSISGTTLTIPAGTTGTITVTYTWTSSMPTLSLTSNDWYYDDTGNFATVWIRNTNGVVCNLYVNGSYKQSLGSGNVYSKLELNLWDTNYSVYLTATGYNNSPTITVYCPLPSSGTGT